MHLKREHLHGKYLSIQVRAHASSRHLPQENHSVQLVKNARQQVTADSSGLLHAFQD